MSSKLGRTLCGVAWLLLALPAAAEETRRESQQVASPDSEAAKQKGVELRFGPGLPAVPGPTSEFGPAQFTEPAAVRPGQAQAEQGALYGATLLAIDGDAARVRLAEGERVLRPGDKLGSETVTRVLGRQIILRRAAQPGHPGGDAVVVAEFDAAGNARVRVVWSQNPGTPIPPEVQ